MKKLKIDIDNKALDFLLYLVNMKRFDAISLWRVLHKPDENNELYYRYLKEEERRWEK